MSVDLVTFDCAHTLVEVDWNLGSFVELCSESIGMAAPQGAFAQYETLFDERREAFIRANMTKNPEVGEQFWFELTKDWLLANGLEPEWAPRLREASDRMAFGSESRVFRLYDDVVACLDRLDELGIRAAIVSNWDYSLHRVVSMFGLTHRFAAVIASLEEGVEKPDPRLFEICLARLGVHPSRTVHVGDSEEDDVLGAQRASVRPVRIDRHARQSTPDVICSLDFLPGVLQSIA